MPSRPTLSRREFLRLSAAAVAALGLSNCATPSRTVRKPRPIAPGAKIRVAQIGCGGRGFTDVRAYKDENVVALCDIDWSSAHMKQLATEFPGARHYTDFRKMLREMDNEIDAVSIATPDHMHFLPAFMAITMGKHVHVQKPLTQTIGEARELRRLARLHEVCTQMGNQGRAGNGIRMVREWVQAGVIGPVREVQIWTDRPIWPQGMASLPPAVPTPEGVDWDVFLGRAPEQSFSPQIHPFKWRGWRAYGCGALGDMACHLMDASFWALDLGAPDSIEAVTTGLTEFAYPTSSTITYQFPARGKMPPVKITWRDGKQKPAVPEDLAGLDAEIRGEVFAQHGPCAASRSHGEIANDRRALLDRVAGAQLGAGGAGPRDREHVVRGGGGEARDRGVVREIAVQRVGERGRDGGEGRKAEENGAAQGHAGAKEGRGNHTENRGNSSMAKGRGQASSFVSG